MEKNENEKNNQEIPIVCYDETIIEVLDKKWKKYLIPRINILKAKYEIANFKEKDNSEINTSANNNNNNNQNLIKILDRDGKEQLILKQVILDLNEDNILYHWLEIPDISNTKILVKKEHLLNMKITMDEAVIMDYYGKKKKIYPGKVCRKAKKYHQTEGKGYENILFKIKDENNKLHFITKKILNFAKKKRMLNYEAFSIEIINKDNNTINVPLENIRDIDETNLYTEYCEINDIYNNKIIVKKIDLQDLKEKYDKNFINSTENKYINDYTLKKLYLINADKEYDNLFPNKYSYLINKEHNEFSHVYDINKNSVYIKTSLIEHYINENLKDLSLYEQVNDKDCKLVTINPYQITRDIIMKYDDIATKNSPCIQLMTQSGSKHIIRKKTILKVLSTSQNPLEYINIKDSNNIKITTSIQKLQEINLNNPDILLISLEDINGKICYISKKIIFNIVNKIVTGESVDETVDVIDYLGEKKNINVRQINIINSSLKKNY